MADKNMNAKISVDFEESASRQSLNSGDSLPTLFGKTKKFFSDLKPVALTGSYDDLSNTPEIPTITIDIELSDISENAVQNKVVKAALDEKAEANELSKVRMAYTSSTQFADHFKLI